MLLCRDKTCVVAANAGDFAVVPRDQTPKDGSPALVGRFG